MKETDAYFFPDWPAPSNIRAVTTTRTLGNISLRGTVELNKVDLNIQQLIADCGLPMSPVWLNQVHANTAIDMTNETSVREADACYTRQPNRICAVLTADCLPILLCNAEGTEIAAIHAGWRGLLAGVIDNTVNSLESPPQDLLAWLGPAIGPDFFEINEQIRIDFSNRDPQNRDCFITKDDHLFADLFQLATLNLQRLGIAKIFGGGECTYTNSEKWYSYRRDKGNTGRMASMIWITE